MHIYDGPGCTRCHLTAEAGLGSSPTRVTCGISQALLAGVLGGYPWVLPFSSHLLIGSSRYEWRHLKRGFKWLKKQQQPDIFSKQQMRESHCELPAYILNKGRNVTCICLCISAQVQSFQISPGIFILWQISGYHMHELAFDFNPFPMSWPID